MPQADILATLFAPQHTVVHSYTTPAIKPSHPSTELAHLTPKGSRWYKPSPGCAAHRPCPLTQTPQATILATLREAAHGLHTLHQAGITHLDLHPQDIHLFAAANSRWFTAKISGYG